MPEKPEVITITKNLEKRILNKTINKVKVIYNNIIDYPNIDEFTTKIANQTVHKLSTRGKWIVIELDTDFLLIHLRMEGKFFYRTSTDKINKHEHVIFYFDDFELRFADVRKFAKIKLISKLDINNVPPFTELGLEPWDKDLTVEYLKNKLSNKTTPIKTVLLDQTIISGIGNIYADEILFLSKINPLQKAKTLKEDNLKDIINYDIKVLDKAILEGGTTIRSYNQEEGVNGHFQNNLLVHQRENKPCTICNTNIIKIKVGGRGTYYCPNCQKIF